MPELALTFVCLPADVAPAPARQQPAAAQASLLTMKLSLTDAEKQVCCAAMLTISRVNRASGELSGVLVEMQTLAGHTGEW